MKRLKSILALIVVLALLGGLGYTAVNGLGEDKSGSLSSINLGLDLAGGVSREYIFHGFVASAEFGQICNNYGIRAGSFSLQQGRDLNAGATFFVSRIYTKALDRQYDVDGLNYWGKEIASGRITPKQAAIRFFHSQEFLNKNLDGSQ